MKIAVLLSGGVDSSVALALLARSRQHEITAFYLKIWLEDELSFLGSCPWQEDIDFAQKICRQWDIPLEVIPFQGEYRERIISYTLDELKKGRTPSPDVYCNERIKFGSFCDKTAHYGFDAIASGHYAQKSISPSGSLLRRAVDPHKDQTYFLAHLKRSQLEKIIFPIGHLQKKDVRAIAAQYDLANKERKDSQGLCFLGKIPFDEFIRFHLGSQPGLIIDSDTGKTLGEHQGYWFYTIGQRKGLGLGGGPWKVLKKDVAQNIVYVCNQNAPQKPPAQSFVLSEVNFPDPLDYSKPMTCKVRHGINEIPVKEFKPLQGEKYYITLSQGDPGLASGQFAVFYQGDICIGSGVMELN